VFLTFVLASALLLACAFFSAAENALVRARRERLEELAEQGDPAARKAEHARRHLDRYLRGARLGIVLSVLGFGAATVPPVGAWLSGILESFGIPAIVAAPASLLTGFIILFVVVLLFGLAIPRSVALRDPERISRATAGPLGMFCTFVGPFLALLEQVEDRAGRADETGRDRPSPDELDALRRGTRGEGGVERDEEAMIHGVFELPHTVAREVMTPRPDLVAFSEDASLDQVLEVAAESGYSRFPVYRQSIDEIVGVVLVKDLLRWVRSSDGSGFQLKKVLRDPFFVPDTKPVDDLLAEFRDQKVHLAIVVDEFGGTDGVVTLEDLVEEIVGDIFDEHDVPEEEIERLPDGRILLDGGADLEDVIDTFDLEGVTDSEEFDTVAGYAIGRLGRIPVAGEVVSIGDAELEILETQEQRVTRLELRLRAATPAPAEQPELEADQERR
jgi:CBS domain containing-hemolysin-like protein